MVGSPIHISDECASSNNSKVDITDSDNEDELENVMEDAAIDLT